MAIYDGEWDIPALEWCSIKQAIGWAAFREEPVDTAYAALTTADDGGDFSEWQWEWNKGRDRIFLHASHGNVALRGRKNAEPPTFNHNYTPARVMCSRWGELEVIPAKLILGAGLGGLLEDGFIFWADSEDDFPFDAWAYTEVQVDFAQLMNFIPPREGQIVRIGGGVLHRPVIMPPQLPSPLSLSEGVVIRARLETQRSDAGGWLEVEDDLPAAAAWLLRQLEAGNLIAKGKFGTRHAHNLHANSPEEQEWAGHAHEREDISPSAWEDWGVNWKRSVLKTRYGEYIQVRIEEVDVRALDAGLAKLPVAAATAPQVRVPESLGNAPPPYLDSSHPNYAPKLAAAVAAWQSVTDDPEAFRNRTVKQAITEWLTNHAADYGLTGSDGGPNNTGIEEAAKVANWNTRGGPPKTPGS